MMTWRDSTDRWAAQWRTAESRRVGFSAVALLLALLLPSMSVGALTLPPPPPGYGWVEFKEGHSAYLRPEGWHVKTQQEGEVATLFISKEDMDQWGSYRTGLSVNLIRNVRQRAGMAPSQFARRSVAQAAAARDVLAQWTSPGEGGTLNVGFRYRDASLAPTMLVHTLLVADDAADALQVLVFGAPESEWDHAWPQGERMMKEMVLG